MPELDEIVERLRGMQAKKERPDRDWYGVQAKADSGRAEVRIYDDIGWYGTNAKTFAQELSALDVDDIDLYLNSVGGDAWDGIAIYNTLRRHKAKVHVTVDAIAASAGSVIAMAGDTLTMNRGSQMMIHDAWGLVMGNAKDLHDAAAMFDKLSDSMADIYAGRAGGSSAEWRAAMAAETWYTADEAVQAGLADSTTDDDAADDARARFDLKAYAFAYAGRAAAPAPAIAARRRPATPKTPAASAAGTARQEGAGQMDPAKIREALGLSTSAPDDEVKAALVTAGFATAAAAPPAIEDDGDGEGDEPATPAPKARKSTKAASGTMNIDVQAWEDTQAQVKSLLAQAKRAAVKERDEVIAQAVLDGKFAPARKDHYAKAWDSDPEGARACIEGLAKGIVPMSALGYDLDGTGEPDEAYTDLFPTDRKKG